jgi:3-methylcrotonyl-CoA carboxylase alpha subunit
MFTSLLIANRGEIAVRVMKTARRLGLRCIAVYSDADRDCMHVALADEAVRIGPAPAAQSYLDIAAIISAARRTGAEAVHPGYGFLSENPAFVDACEAAGLVFVGPPASAIRAMGLKDAAKRLMEQAGVPVVPGYHGEDQEPAALASEAERIGYPVLIKARAGGGGKGMRRVDEPADFPAALESAQREAVSSFGDGGVIVERFVSRPRHIEVQVFADAHANAVHLFERDCSLQRRHQKVIEEAPAPGMTPEMRAAMGDAAVKAALAVGYRGAGTVEFIADASAGLRPDRFFFMEMNTRLQVEHPVTEAITGIDLVAWQLRVAAGEKFTLSQEQISRRGHAFEARIYAEDPKRNFAPAIGRLDTLELPTALARVDTGVRAGDAITHYYDPMIAKVIVHGRDRASALRKLARALEATRATGCVTNVAFLAALVRHPDFASGDVDTGLIERDLAQLTAVEAPSAEAVALAALAAAGLLRDAAPTGTSPWDRLVAWRIWGTASFQIEFDHDATGIAATLVAHPDGRREVTSAAGTTALQVLAADDAMIRYESDGVVRTATVMRAPGETHVRIGGLTHTFRDPANAAADVDADTGDDVIRAPLPGLVKLVAAEPGATCAKGGLLVVMEAMKMEHTLTSPRDVVVAEVLVAPGDSVQEGSVLVRLERP